MNETPSIPSGRYRHYKEYGEHGLWVRPKQMFSETVKVDGHEVLRFQPLGSSSEQVGESIKNIFDDLPQHMPKEVVQTLIRAADVRIERIVSHGHASVELVQVCASFSVSIKLLFTTLGRINTVVLQTGVGRTRFASSTRLPTRSVEEANHPRCGCPA